MISRKDVISVASSIKMHIDERDIAYVLENFQGATNENDLWFETVENILYSIPKEKEIVSQEEYEQYLHEQPNPMDYEDSPEGDAKYWDDYWGGDFDAMSYHDDMGDR